MQEGSPDLGVSLSFPCVYAPSRGFRTVLQSFPIGCGACIPAGGAAGHSLPFPETFTLQEEGSLPGCKESQVFNSCPSNSQPTALVRDTVLLNSLFFVDPGLLATLGRGPAISSLCHFLNSLPSWIQWQQTALLVWSLCRQSSCAWGPCPATLQLSFENVTLWYPYCSSESLSGSLRTPPPPKVKSLSQSWLPSACLCL